MIMEVGIIGFGTVGSVLSNLFNRSGISFAVYDILLEDPSRKEFIIQNAKKYNAPVMDLPSLIEQSMYIISAVTTQVAEEVANVCLPCLKEGQIFIDCNSTSPGIKINIQKIIHSGSADFVEGVILNAVNPGDTGLSMLVGGERGREITDFFQKTGIKAKFYEDEVGKASMFKMLRSIFSKGVEVLLLETLVAAKKAGIEKELWNEITNFMDSKSFVEIGETWIKSHAVAYERRYHEMQQVIETMNELEVPSLLTQASLQFFRQSMKLKLNTFFSKTPDNADEVVRIINDQLELSDGESKQVK